MSAVGRGIVLRQIDRLFGEGTLTGLGDGQLLERYLTRRDEDAFEAIVDLHGPMVLGLCRRMLRDPRDIEDAFQATFLVLVRKAPAIRDRALLSSWLYGVAYRVARRARTRTLRRRVRECTVGELEVAAEPEPPGHPESDPMLDQELSRLPEKYRVTLVLCYLRGRTHDQAAEELRCPVGTVRSRLARGRELLRKRLVRRGYAPTVPAALLGGDTTLPARLLLATVPPPLAAATVRAALGFGSSSIFKTGAAAATSAVLAQGVLTTMKLAQLKWIGLAVLATSLSAGGVVAVGYGAAQRLEAPTDEHGAEVVRPDEAQEKKVETPTEKYVRETEQKIDQLLKDIGFYPSDGSDGGPASDGSLATRVLQRKLGPLLNGGDAAGAMAVASAVDEPKGGQGKVPRRGTDERIQSLEDKLDQVLKSLGMSVTPSGHLRAEFPPDPGTDRAVPDDSRARNPASRMIEAPKSTASPIGALEAQLNVAMLKYQFAATLSRKNVVSHQELALAGSEVLIIVGQVEGVDQESQDELERLEIERSRKEAQLERAKAQEEMAGSLVARNKRLNDRKPDMVGPDDVARAVGSLKIAIADVRIAGADVREVDLRIRQATRKHAQIREVAKRAERVKREIRQTAPAEKP